MGVGQAVALQPGVSRSGATITVGRFLDLSRDAAARFAFLMSLPITVGALLFKAVDASQEGVPSALWPAFVWGIVAVGPHRLDRGVGHAPGGPHPHVHARSSSTGSWWAWPC